MPPVGLALLVIILVTAAILGVKQMWFKGPPKTAETSMSANAGQNTSTPDSIRELINKVSKHIIVKANEDPTVATIQDVDILKRQNPMFYKDAQNGDRLLIWSDKAVLYSAPRDIILAVLPISLPASALNQQVGSASGTAAGQAKAETAIIEVRNGTGTVGMAKLMADKLSQLGLSVLKPADAKKKDYTQTVVVKLTDKELPQTLQAIMAATGNARVVTLPAGENASKADFLVIVGADFKK
jgi:hypothetical protein